MVLNAPNALRRSLLVAAAACAAGGHPAAELVAVRVRSAETVSDGRIEHAVILIDGGKIVTIGQDLPIDRGIRVLDLSEWTAMPGLVSCYSRLGMSSESSGGNEPQELASDELWPRADEYEDVLELGVTTLGLYPPGDGIPGQAVAVRPHGETVDEMIVRDRAYLKILLLSNAGSKKMLRDGFDKADKYGEKEAKRREKWEKDQEKDKKKKSKKDDEKEKKEESKALAGPRDDEEKGDETYQPEPPDADVLPFLQLRSGELSAVIEIRQASDWLHLMDALADEELTWSLRAPLRGDSDLYEVVEKIGEKGARVVVEPNLTQVPGTRRLRNLPLELVAAGAKLAFVPRWDSLRMHEQWLVDVGELVAAGLDREVALRAMTLEPAEVLRLADRLGSLSPGKDANILFLDGDPLQATSRVKAVMLEGRIVHGEVKQ